MVAECLPSLCESPDSPLSTVDIQAKKLEDKEAKSTKTSLRDIESIKATKDPPR